MASVYIPTVTKPLLYDELRLRYAGVIGLLCSLHLTASAEDQEVIREAVADWCEFSGWRMVKVMDRLSIEPPIEEVNC